MTRTARLAAIAAAVLIAIGTVMWLTGALTSGKRAKVEAELNAGRAGAATASGRDAVETVGAIGAAEDETDNLTRENEHEIRQAEGAGARVADPARDAGLRSLCRRAAYRDRPECLQRPVAD